MMNNNYNINIFIYSSKIYIYVYPKNNIENISKKYIMKIASSISIIFLINFMKNNNNNFLFFLIKI